MYSLQSLKIANIISFKEQEFVFRNGKAILIVGHNLDEAQNQNGNGSGKSSLIESISLAFTGTSLRDVKTKELIHSDQESGEVTLTLLNKISGVEFIIWRKLYVNTKSAEYRSWVNGKEQSDRYADLNGFNAFVWETIGISKEDFYSFFLITKENYVPFLLIGDTAKKAIINRFSGADRVDNAMPFIQQDSEAIAKQIMELEKCLVANQTRQSVLAEQIIEEENRSGEEAQKIKIAQIETEVMLLIEAGFKISTQLEEARQQVANTVADLSFSQDEQSAILAPYHSAIKAAEKEWETFSKELDSKLLPLKDAVNYAQLAVDGFQFTKNYGGELGALMGKRILLNKEIEEKKKSIPLARTLFVDEISAIQKEEKELGDDLKLVEAELKINEQLESEISKSLQDAIECPKCRYHFSLRSESFNYESAQELLKTTIEAIAEYKGIAKELKTQILTTIQQKKQDVNAKILTVQEGIKNEIEVLNQSLVKIGNDELALKQEQQVELSEKESLNNVVLINKRALENKQRELEHDNRFYANAVNVTKQDLAEKKQELKNQLSQLQQKIKKAEIDLKAFEQDFTANDNQIKSLQELILRLQSQEIDKSKVLELEGKIRTLILAEEALNKQMEAKRIEKEAVDKWELHFRGFKSHLANKCIGNIEQYTNLFLQNMGSNLTISIEGYRQLASKKLKEQITTIVNRNGFEAGSYGKFSGGERSRIDVAAILALQELILVNAGHGKGIDFLCVDEILESVDLTGMECILNSLQPLQKTIMLVSQHTEISSLAQHTLTVQKKNKVSTILM